MADGDMPSEGSSGRNCAGGALDYNPLSPEQREDATLLAGMIKIIVERELYDGEYAAQQSAVPVNVYPSTGAV